MDSSTKMSGMGFMTTAKAMHATSDSLVNYKKVIDKYQSVVVPDHVVQNMPFELKSKHNVSTLRYIYALNQAVGIAMLRP